MKLARTTTVIATVVAFLLAAGAPARAEPNDDGNRAWSVRPATADGKPDKRTHYTLQGALGGKVEEHVLVTNSSKVRATFLIYGTDAFNTSTGAFDLLPAATKPTDIGSWMKFPSPTVDIDPGASVAIPFIVDVPQGATPGDHAGGVVVSLATNGSDVKLDTRVAVRLYLRIAGLLRPTLEAQKVQATYSGTANPVGKGGVDVTYTVVNTGNIRLSSHAKVYMTSTIFGTHLGSEARRDLPELLPGQRVTYTAHIDGVFPAGPIDANVDLEPYPDPAQPVGQQIATAKSSVTIWAIPWLLTLVVIAVLVGLAVLLGRRFGRPRPKDKSKDSTPKPRPTLPTATPKKRAQRDMPAMSK
ncbi:WxL protein peptidoglycan domain-containing protein [Dactylosporangium sp. CA-233914]|uniref:WxL protein peptidoglycan domain-containing protein n=1 Tax=Dactylosporangium sp. CA-233914 TaxID=3239934 RepID=UPI003D90DAF3